MTCAARADGQHATTAPATPTPTVTTATDGSARSITINRLTPTRARSPTLSYVYLDASDTWASLATGSTHTRAAPNASHP
eukprot:6187845-Pyramimonas_sp.AAC.1